MRSPCWVSAAPAKVAAAALLLACAGPAWPLLDPSGVYLRGGGAPARLEVRRDGDAFRVALEAAAPASGGAGAAADCIVEAAGRLAGDSIEARFPGMSAQRPDHRLRIRFSGAAAEVVEADTFGHCGLGSDLLGRYLLEGPTR